MMNKFEKTFNLLEKTGLNWTVTKEALVTADGKPTQSFGIFRKDTSGWLGTVGSSYVPFQNAELAETIVEAAGTIGIDTDKGGMLYNGRKVFIQAQLPDEHIGNSGIKRYITALNTHNGSTCIGFGSTNTVIICNNTFHRAYKEIEKFRHTASAKARIEIAIEEMHRTMREDNKLMTVFKRMADLPIKDEAIERVIRKLFDVTPGMNQDEISTRRRNRIVSFSDSLAKEIDLEGRTIWALFNGVTRFTNHIAAPAKENERNDYLMAGGGYKLSNMAFDELAKWVDENTAELVPVLA